METYYAIERTNTRTGAKHATLYADDLDTAHAHVKRWCGGLFGNVATIYQLPDAKYAHIGTYAWNMDTQSTQRTDDIAA